MSSNELLRDNNIDVSKLEMGIEMSESESKKGFFANFFYSPYGITLLQKVGFVMFLSLPVYALHTCIVSSTNLVLYQVILSRLIFTMLICGADKYDFKLWHHKFLIYEESMYKYASIFE